MPRPSSLSTDRLAVHELDGFRDDARPSPVPPAFLVLEESSWVKRVNAKLILSGGMPMPVSATSNSIGRPASRALGLFEQDRSRAVFGRAR